MPMAGDDVVIPDVAVTTQITFNASAGSVEIDSLTSNESLLITGGTLAIVDTAQLNAPFTLSGGILAGDGTITEYTLPDLDFTFAGDVQPLTQSMPNTLKLGEFFIRPPSFGNINFEIDINDGGFVQFSRNSSFTIEVLPGGTLSFSSGSFTGSFTGSAKLFGVTVASASGSVSESGCLTISGGGLTQYFALAEGACNDVAAIAAYSINGYIAGGLMFFDANGNGVLDYLDLNGDGVQDDDEPHEPSAITAADGSAILIVPDVFDRNGDGQFTPDEGRLVVIGGVDLSTGLPLEVMLTAPIVNGSATVVSPLSTLADRLLSAHGLSASDALRLVRDHFELVSVDLGSFDPIAALAIGDPRAADVFAARAKLHDTVQQIGRLLSGATGDSTGVGADAAISLLAQQLADGADSTDFSDPAFIAALIADTAAAQSATVNTELLDAAAAVIAADNQQIDQIPRGDDDFLLKAKAVQQVAQGVVGEDLLAAGAGGLTPDELLIRNTAAALADRIAAARVGSLTPARIAIDDPVVIADTSGRGELVFTIRLSEPSDLPISLAFATRDGTAQAANRAVFGLATL